MATKLNPKSIFVGGFLQSKATPSASPFISTSLTEMK
jgi:hypothetical protein